MRLRQPNWPRFLPTKVVVGAATLGPLGRKMRAPGTWGSLAGLMYFTVFFYQLSWVGYVLLCLSGLYLAVGFCGEAEFRLGQRDPGQIILDEFTAMPLCFLGWTALAHHYPPWAIFLAGFALFRLFDISKPFGIRKIQDLPAGWGVVADDVMAALATCLSMHLIAWVMRAF